MNKNQLQALLKQYNYNISLENSIKGIDHLLDEINKGECTLAPNESGALIRTVHTVIVYVYCNELQLYEAIQQYSDGTVRERGYEYLSEKFNPESESPEQAVRRALQEEIGVTEIESITSEGSEVTQNTKSSYTDLSNISDIRTFSVKIPEKEFRNEYREVGKEKTTVFRWKSAKLNNNL